ncbi:MAG: DUF6868 family protein [Pseudomonadota bacterium]
MTIELVMRFLGWTACINIAFLLWWFLAVMFMRDTVYRLHTRLFNLTQNQFDVIHYSGMAASKLLVLIFNVAPYIALEIIN